MIKGKTEKGFEFEVEDDALDDWELTEDLVEIDNGNFGRIVSAINRFLGIEQAKAFKEFYRNDKGKISSTELMNALKEIFDLAGKQGKN